MMPIVQLKPQFYRIGVLVFVSFGLEIMDYSMLPICFIFVSSVMRG